MADNIRDALDQAKTLCGSARSAAGAPEFYDRIAETLAPYKDHPGVDKVIRMAGIATTLISKTFALPHMVDDIDQIRSALPPRER